MISGLHPSLQFYLDGGWKKLSEGTNHPWLENHGIYLTLHGSHAYGTAGPNSDLDIRGIFILPKNHYYSYALPKCQVIDKGFKEDVSLFELRRFFELAASCNPNALELLYTDESDRLYVNDVSRHLLYNRDKFLSKKVRHTFSGYAMSQLKRIQNHHRWLRMVADGREPQKPTRAEFGLPERSTVPVQQREAAESLIRKQVESWDVPMDTLDEAAKISLRELIERTLTEMKLASEEEVWQAAGRHIGIDTDMMAVIVQERRYQSKLKEYRQYKEWVANRNPERAALEAKYGFDAKNGMHLIRLYRMAREVLEGKGLIVRRPDAEELLAIRNGAWSYEKLMEWAHEQDASLDEVYNNSKLPHSVNHKELDELCVNMINMTLNR